MPMLKIMMMMMMMAVRGGQAYMVTDGHSKHTDTEHRSVVVVVVAVVDVQVAVHQLAKSK